MHRVLVLLIPFKKMSRIIHFKLIVSEIKIYQVKLSFCGNHWNIVTNRLQSIGNDLLIYTQFSALKTTWGGWNSLLFSQVTLFC